MNINQNPNLAAPFQTIERAAMITGRSQFAIRTGVRNGTIPYLREGRRILINVPAMLEQMNRQSEASVTNCN